MQPPMNDTRPNAELIDIGVNLTSKRFDSDRHQVIERALDAGVRYCLVTGTDMADSEKAVRLCETMGVEYQNSLRCTAGVHPHEADQLSNETARQLLQLIQDNRDWIVAVGETGLDFNRNFSSPSAQEKAFEAQLELAAETGLPLFLHERDAHQRQFDILQHWRDNLSGGVQHCFTGDRRGLFRYLDLDLHIGITGWICDERRGLELQRLVKDIPLDRLLVETDAPYLTPRTLKPKPKSGRNEPAFLPAVIATIAEHRPECEQEIAIATSDNARRLFGFGE